jgi:hypothetical protein
LIAVALVHHAGELLRGVPSADRAGVIAEYQNYLAMAAGQQTH